MRIAKLHVRKTKGGNCIFQLYFLTRADHYSFKNTHDPNCQTKEEKDFFFDKEKKKRKIRHVDSKIDKYEQKPTPIHVHFKQGI